MGEYLRRSHDSGSNYVDLAAVMGGSASEILDDEELHKTAVSLKEHSLVAWSNSRRLTLPTSPLSWTMEGKCGGMVVAPRRSLICIAVARALGWLANVAGGNFHSTRNRCQESFASLMVKHEWSTNPARLQSLKQHSANISGPDEQSGCAAVCLVLVQGRSIVSTGPSL